MLIDRSIAIFRDVGNSRGCYTVLAAASAFQLIGPTSSSRQGARAFSVDAVSALMLIMTSYIPVAVSMILELEQNLLAG